MGQGYVLNLTGTMGLKVVSDMRQRYFPSDNDMHRFFNLTRDIGTPPSRASIYTEPALTCQLSTRCCHGWILILIIWSNKIHDELNMSHELGSKLRLVYLRQLMSIGECAVYDISRHLPLFIRTIEFSYVSLNTYTILL